MRINVLIAFAIVLSVGIAVLGVKSAIHSDVRSAHAGLVTGSAPSISVYDIQANAKNLPEQNVKDAF
jgi:hypothetical protein